MSDVADSVKSSQAQAVAAWIDHLNQVRLDDLLGFLRQQDLNFQDALTSLDEALRDIDVKVVATNRGGLKGMHGFIAEVAEVGVANARSTVRGGGGVYQWVNDNGPVDLMRAGVEIQQKFVAVGGRFGLGAIVDHLEKYPDFVKNGGKYQIPADHFEIVQKLHAMGPDEARQLLTRSDGGLSLNDWERVRAFFGSGSVSIESLEPSTLEYRQVQAGVYRSTLEAEKQSVRATDASMRNDAYREAQPKLHEGAKASLVGAAVEGGTAFVLAVVEKRRNGKNLKDFTSQDWGDIAGESGFGFAKGGVRGISVYALTNVTATSAAVASSLVTAAFGIAEQANKFRLGEITEVEFIENAELVALDTAVSALSSLVGQVLIPVPVLGAVIGNTVGTIMYRAVSSSLSQREIALIERYLSEQRAIDARLSVEYREIIDHLEACMSDYLGVLERAFSPDVDTAFRGSIDLAIRLGVTSDEIIDSDEKNLAYFLD